jgi:hypothetical protein
MARLRGDYLFLPIISDNDKFVIDSSRKENDSGLWRGYNTSNNTSVEYDFRLQGQ